MEFELSEERIIELYKALIEKYPKATAEDLLLECIAKIRIKKINEL